MNSNSDSPEIEAAVPENVAPDTAHGPDRCPTCGQIIPHSKVSENSAPEPAARISQSFVYRSVVLTAALLVACFSFGSLWASFRLAYPNELPNWKNVRELLFGKPSLPESAPRVTSSPPPRKQPATASRPPIPELKMETARPSEPLTKRAQPKADVPVPAAATNRNQSATLETLVANQAAWFFNARQFAEGAKFYETRPIPTPFSQSNPNHLKASIARIGLELALLRPCEGSPFVPMFELLDGPLTKSDLAVLQAHKLALQGDQPTEGILKLLTQAEAEGPFYLPSVSSKSIRPALLYSHSHLQAEKIYARLIAANKNDSYLRAEWMLYQYQVPSIIRVSPKRFFCEFNSAQSLKKLSTEFDTFRRESTPSRVKKQDFLFAHVEVIRANSLNSRPTQKKLLDRLNYSATSTVEVFLLHLAIDLHLNIDCELSPHRSTDTMSKTLSVTSDQSYYQVLNRIAQSNSLELKVLPDGIELKPR